MAPTLLNKLFLTQLGLILLVSNLAAHSTLIYPKGGENVIVGETLSINWRADITHGESNWDLYFSSDGGSSWEALSLDMPSSQTTYQWIVPNVITEQAQIRIVQDNAETDYPSKSSNFSIAEVSTAIPTEDQQIKEFVLYPNFPNPFNPSTTVPFSLTKAEKVQMVVFNSVGQEVKIIINRPFAAGRHRISWDGKDSKGLPAGSGIYFIRMQAGDFSAVRRLTLIR